MEDKLPYRTLGCYSIAASSRGFRVYIKGVGQYLSASGPEQWPIIPLFETAEEAELAIVAHELRSNGAAT